jgi:RNA recognition motif-containing protein
MPIEEEAKEAIENLNDISLGKKPMVVKAAEERQPGTGGGNFNRRPGGFQGNRGPRRY